jgi:hypothetical protein
MLAGQTAPLAVLAHPLGGDDRLAESRKLERDRAVGIQPERTAVEYQFVLPAEHVEIDQRQATLDHARNRDIEAHLRLVAPIGRAVRHQQDFAARFGDALDHIRPPDVLAHRNADAHAAQDDRSRQRPRLEHALLVEHTVVRQIDLVARGRDLAAFEQKISIVELAVLDPRRPDQHGRPAVPRLAGQRLDRGAAGGLECGLEHEVFGWVTRDEQFGEHHHIGALPRRGRARAAHLLGIAGDIADSRVELRKRDGEAVGGTSVHVVDLTMRPPDGNASDDSEPFGERQQPGKARDRERDANGGRAHVLDAANLGMVGRGDVVGELLDRGVEQFDDEQQQDHADERKAFPGERRYEVGERNGQRERH